ncbi:MAG TPA: flagellar filament protein FlaA, partial [Spirochaetia bacterium]|nr:flagellar filament protein FlaA [Spirochaetia bacterium]
VVGRNYNHELKIIVADFYGNRAELSLGRLNFSGWRKLSVAIPPRLVQSDFHYTAKEGLKFMGLKVVCNPAEAFGTYYIYFDDVSAETDLFSMKSRDEDDVDDGW